jgi:hypothetical protein
LTYSEHKASVTLLAFGRAGYAHAAANLAASLRHFGYKGTIHLHLADALLPHVPQWALSECVVHSLTPSTTPCLTKLSLPALIDGPTLFLDVDMVALQDITPWLDALASDGRDFIAQVQGQGKAGEPIEYFAWAKPQACADKHALPADATFYGLQSSWMFMRPGDTLDALYITANDIHDQWSVKELDYDWGGGLPDELFWSLACTIEGHDPAIDMQPIFFGAGHESLPELMEKYYVFTLYGRKGQVPPRYIEAYDGIMRHVSKAAGRHHDLKSNRILADKLCNYKKPTTHGVQFLRQ